METSNKILIAVFIFIFIVAIVSILLITVKVPYTGYSVYTEKEPYIDTENYSDKEPGIQQVPLKYQDVTQRGAYIARPCLWDETFSCTLPAVMNIDTVGGTFAVNCTFKTLYDQVSFYDTHYIAPGDYFEFNCRGKPSRGSDIIASYKFIPPNKEITKYNDVQKTREVTQYRDVAKVKEVIKYCNAWKQIVGQCKEDYPNIA